eukprot:gene18124-19934_t
MATFRKRAPISSSRSQGLPLGTKASFQNNQLLVSTGVPSLDNVLEEDTYRTYSDLLTKYFIAEGVLCHHEIAITSADKEKYDEIVKNLPAPIEESMSPSKVATQPQETPENKGSEEELKIAWRYKNLSVNEPKSKALQFGHYYDLTKYMDQQYLSNASMTNIHVHDTKQDELSTKIHPICKKIIKDIQDIIARGSYSTTSDVKGERKILRVVVPSIGSPFWPTYGVSTLSLTWLLVCLRAVLRSAFAVCLVTVSSQLLEDPVLLRRLEQCSDSAVRLESFAGSEKEKSQAFKDYDGLIHTKKKTRINYLYGQEIDTSDWAFKLRRKKFSIEKLHLPPELSETANRAQVDTKKINIQSGNPLCNTSLRSTSSKSIEF